MEDIITIGKPIEYKKQPNVFIDVNYVPVRNLKEDRIIKIEEQYNPKEWNINWKVNLIRKSEWWERLFKFYPKYVDSLKGMIFERANKPNNLVTVTMEIPEDE